MTRCSIFKFWWVPLLCAAGCARLGNPSAPNSVALVSPDGAVRFQLLADAAGLKYEVRHGHKVVIEPSPMVVMIDGKAITDGVRPGAATRFELNETYPWRGVHATARNRCRGATISLTHAKGDLAFKLEVWVFNDGVAFRQMIPGDSTTRVPDEATKFIIPAGSTVWHHGLGGHYEDVHTKSAISDIPSGEWCAPPMTFQLPDGSYAAITEAALVNYSGMALQADGQRGFTVVLGHNHPVSYPFRLRYSNDITRVSEPAALAGTITSPWRVVMIARDLNALVNSDIVHNLCPPPDMKLFPHGMRADWIRPGRAVWRYLDGGRNTLEEVKNFSRWAGELGFEYQVVEGFWSRWSEEQAREAVEDARRSGIGLWFWRHSRELRTPEAREQFFSRLAKLGVVGAKIDFFDHEHKEIVELYTELLTAAAKHRIMVNFHGANKPTGEPRTWPNELIREGVRGMEASRLQARARHNATLPFTRFVAGHGDYTPALFGPRRGDTTWAHQIATAAVFDEPLLTWGAHPTNLLQHPAVEMIRSIPAAWDETIVLPPSEIGELAVYARRAGDRWFLAALNGPAARTVKIPLSFLGSGEYDTLRVGDRMDEPAAVQIERTTARRSQSIDVELRAGGGLISRFDRR